MEKNSFDWPFYLTKVGFVSTIYTIFLQVWIVFALSVLYILIRTNGNFSELIIALLFATFMHGYMIRWSLITKYNKELKAHNIKHGWEFYSFTIFVVIYAFITLDNIPVIQFPDAFGIYSKPMMIVFIVLNISLFFGAIYADVLFRKELKKRRKS